MKNCYDFKKINAYIDNELSRSERDIFESELSRNSDLQNELEKAQNLLHDLKHLPKVDADRNFMVSLNNKIDDYERSIEKKWYSVLLDFLPDYSPMQIGIGTLSIAVLVTLTVFVTQTPSSTGQSSSLNANKMIIEDTIQTADDKENDKDDDSAGVADGEGN